MFPRIASWWLARSCSRLWRRRHLTGRQRHVLLVLWRLLETGLGLFGNIRLGVGRLQRAINVSEIGLVEVRGGFVGQAKVGQVTTRGHEAHIITVIDIVRGVRHQNDGMSFFVGDVAQHRHHFAIQARIESRCRLIQEEDVGLRQQLQGNRDALLLPTRQLVDQQFAALGDAHRFHHFLHTLFDLLVRCIAGQTEFRGIVQHALDGQVLVNDVELRHVAKLRAKRGARGVVILTVIEDAASFRRSRAVEGVHQHGFASTGTADDCDKFAARYGERDVIE